MMKRQAFPTLQRRSALVLMGQVFMAALGVAGLSSFAFAQTSTPTPEQLADYQRKLADYNAAQQKFTEDVKAYWDLVSAQRAVRNGKRRNGEQVALNDYVLTQPPVYQGPPQPMNPAAPPVTPPPVSVTYIPVKADFLKNAAAKFNFVPRVPVNEAEFKKAYARAANAAAVLKDQAVRIYGFEAGGNGTYDVQAGLEYNVPGARAISTALGYNQLLNTNSVELLAEEGDQFVKALEARATTLTGSDQAALNKKIETLKSMIEFSKSVPDEWSEHVKLGNEPEGLGIHALNLDVDVGPLLQTQKLLNSIKFAKSKGRLAPLTAAELEMMNLTGDGNGFDMISAPLEWRSQIPTSNFFQRSGYDDNSVVRRNNVISTLLAATDAKMDSESKLPGAKDLGAAFP